MVPSLVACCLNALIPYADQISLPTTLRIRPHDTILDDLVPDPANLDPRLWAVLAQVYDALPQYFQTQTLPLTSPHMPLLQSLIPSPHFSVITLLNLSACPDLQDDSMVLFKSLHTLVGLDASSTSLTSHAIYTLGGILQYDDDGDAARPHRGPWELRILSLRNCKQINDDVYPYLNKFPLLSVVDLRGTQCTPPKESPFEACPVSTLHYPASLAESITELQSMEPELFLSAKPYILGVDKMKIEVRRKHVPAVGPRDAFVVIPANPFRPVRVGNTNVLEMQKQAEKESRRHEQNKDAWYERQERLEERGDETTTRSPVPTPARRLCPPRPRESVPVSGGNNPSYRFGVPEYRTAPKTIIPRAQTLSGSRDNAAGPAERPASVSTPFYSRLPLRMTAPKPLVMYKVEEGDPALKLHRQPPRYSKLASTLRERKANRERERAVREGRLNALQMTAVIDQTGMRAERARKAIELAVQGRMTSASASSSTFPPEDSQNVFKKRRHITPSFESSFPPEPSRTRNPFRKSLPACVMGPPLFDTARKIGPRHSLGNMHSSTSTPAPLIRPSKSTTDLRSSDFGNKVGYQGAPVVRVPSTPNNKPLVPISSIKIPELSEDLRKEVAARERAEIAKIKRAGERKRKKAEQPAGDATDSDEEELKRALKKRASIYSKIGVGSKKPGRDATTTSEKTSPESLEADKTTQKIDKGKGKAATGKKSGFDWNGWGKK